MRVLTQRVSFTLQLRADVLRVRLRLQQPVDLRRIARLDPNHPARPVGIGIDQCRLLVESLVDGDDLAANGGEELRYRLHGLDGPEHVVLAEGGPDLGQLDIYDIAELALRVVGDADLDGAVLRLADVLMFLGVLQIAWDVCH